MKLCEKLFRLKPLCATFQTRYLTLKSPSKGALSHYNGGISLSLDTVRAIYPG